MSEWIRGIGSDCGGVGGVGRDWIRGLDQGGMAWCYVCVSLESLCRWQV